VWMWYFRDEPREHPSITPEELARLPARARGKGKRIPWLSLAKRIAPVTAVDFCFGWTLWLFQSWIPTFFVQSYGLDLGTAAVLTSVVLFMGVIGDTVGGVVSDHILRRTGSLVLARRSVIIAGFLGAALFLLPVIAVQDLTVAVIFLALAFFCSELIVAPIWAVPMDIAPRYAGSASGMMNFGFGFAGILSPLVFGYLTDVTGGWSVPFLVSVGLFLVGAALTLRLRPDIPFADPTEPEFSVAAGEISEPRSA
jgi:MFS family permease